MARGSTQLRNDAQNQTNSDNAWIAQQQQEQQQGINNLMPKYESYYDNAGFTPAESSALTQDTVGPISNIYDSMREAAKNRMAATRNSAGFGDLMSQLGRQQSQDTEQAERENTIAQRQYADQNKLAALQGMSGLYGINTDLLSRIANLPNESMSNFAQGLSPSAGQYAMGLLSSGVGAVSGGIGTGLGKRISG